MSSVIEAIKAKIDVVDEIGLVVALQKSGKSFKGLCPFHNERTPSFYVFPDAQTWHCFGCNEGGDIFSFVQKQQNLDFREALLYLGEKTNVAVEDFGGHDSEQARKIHAARERLFKLNGDALLWFHQALLRSKDAQVAREYVESRGISSNSVIAFALGYALDQWDGLSSYLLTQGYTEQELVTAGLARRRDEHGGGIYDYFRNRLIFPIRDIRGRVIGFGGRALGEGKPKYLNSPQTLLFEKNSVLYAIDMAKDAIKQAKQVVIVEGYVDAVIAHQYGTKQTVACIGSAITEKHIQQLKKLTRQVTLALDPDAAGSAATEHGIEEALKTFDRTVVPVPLAAEHVDGSHKSNGASRTQKPRSIIRLEEQVDAEINVLQLPQGEDPDELIRRDFSTWLYAVTHPMPLVDYFFVVKTADLNLREPSGQTQAAKRLLPVIGMITDRIKRDAYLRKLSAMIGSDERVLHEELQHVLKSQQSQVVVAEFSSPAKSVQQPVRRSPGTGSTSFSVHKSNGVETQTSPKSTSSLHHMAEVDRKKKNTLQLEDYLIGLLLRNPDLNRHVCDIINDGDFAGTDTRELYHILNSIYQRDSSPPHQSFEQVVPLALLETVTRAQKRVEMMAPKDGEGLVREAKQCATRLKRARLLQLNMDLQYLIREAAAAGNQVQERQLRQQVLENQKLLQKLYTSSHLQG